MFPIDFCWNFHCSLVQILLCKMYIHKIAGLTQNTHNTVMIHLAIYKSVHMSELSSDKFFKFQVGIVMVYS